MPASVCVLSSPDDVMRVVPCRNRKTSLASANPHMFFIRIDETGHITHVMDIWRYFICEDYGNDQGVMTWKYSQSYPLRYDDITDTVFDLIHRGMMADHDTHTRDHGFMPLAKVFFDNGFLAVSHRTLDRNKAQYPCIHVGHSYEDGFGSRSERITQHGATLVSLASRNAIVTPFRVKIVGDKLVPEGKVVETLPLPRALSAKDFQELLGEGCSSPRTIRDGVEVFQSTIRGAGRGLFISQTAVRRGDIITEFSGRMISGEEASELRARGLDTHCRTLCPDIVLDGRNLGVRKGGAAFANDCKKSAGYNSMFVTVYSELREPASDSPASDSPTSDSPKHSLFGLERLFLRATTDIPVGAEVFVCYGQEFWDNHRAKNGKRKR